MLSFPIRIFRVAERSMEPTIKEGSYLLVLRWKGALEPGDVVVLRHPVKNMLIVKRIQGIDRDGVYVVGDNPYESEDSRKFGKVDLKKVVGKVFFVV